MQVRISRSLLDRILADAASSDEEVCGLLFGDAGTIRAVEPCANRAADPGRAFELDPGRLIAAYRAMRAGGPTLIGHYHSPPDRPCGTLGPRRGGLPPATGCCG